MIPGRVSNHDGNVDRHPQDVHQRPFHPYPLLPISRWTPTKGREQGAPFVRMHDDRQALSPWIQDCELMVTVFVVSLGSQLQWLARKSKVVLAHVPFGINF